MGLLSFLSTLTNGAMGGEDPQNPHGQWGVDQDGYLSPQGQAPQPQAPASSGDPKEIVVTGGTPDGWRPRKQTILGALADGYMKAHGQGSPFQEQRDKRNLQEAMEGFSSDPMKAIRRIGKFDPEAAWKMYNQQVDNTRQAGSLERTNNLLDFQKQKYVYGQLSNMMGVAAKRNDPSTWEQMRNQALTYARQYGIDAGGIIPEEYDPNAIETIALGSVPVGKQMQNTETHEYHQATTDYRNRNLEERSSYHQGQLGISSERNRISAGSLGERKEHDDVTEGQRQEQIDKTPPKPGRKFLDTKYGRGEIAGDGQSMRIKVADPRYHHDKDGYIVYDNVDGKWRLRK